MGKIPSAVSIIGIHDKGPHSLHTVYEILYC